MSGLRDIQLIETDSNKRCRAKYVVGIDESGNPIGGEPFVLTAVQCPRDAGELLAEQLIHSGLNPWTNKSQSLSSLVDKQEQTQRVQQLITCLTDIPVTWCSVAGWNEYNNSQKAASACLVASKAITASPMSEAPSYSGPAVLLPDGSSNTYSNKQRLLRQHAAAQFSGGFTSRYCPVYVSSLSKGDLTYPAITAADYIAGYIRHQMQQGISVEELPKQVLRIDESWSTADNPPTIYYSLRPTGGMQNNLVRSRAISWIEGRKIADEGSLSGRKPYKRIVHRLSSEEVQMYLQDL